MPRVPIKKLEGFSMAHPRISLLLCIALLISAAASAQENRNRPAAVSGAYSVTFKLSLLSTLPARTTITCKAQIAPNQGGPELANPHPAQGLVETATGLAVVAGPKATCAVKIPFAWTVTGMQSGVVLGYEIDAVSHLGAAPLLVRSSARQNITAPFPAQGGNASLSFNLVF
jgi:hypothetical protein